MPTEEPTSNQAAAVRSYAIRRVNPFLGVLQVIETGAGRAISANGVVWDIEVLAERSGGWGSLNRNDTQLAFYRYGLWSLQDGLVSRPLAPHLESDPLTHKCNHLIECIRERLDQLPFELVDHRELWLFDKDGRLPLALLASATADGSLPSPEPRYWSSRIGADGVPSQRRFPESAELESQVKQRAGFNIQKHWVTRRRDRSGTIAGRDDILPADLFPPFLITEDWPEPAQADLVDRYIQWIAPSLLTLQHLDKAQRQRLEHSLTTQAVSVEHHCQLYPEIVDETLIKAARVQCRLQQSAAK